MEGTQISFLPLLEPIGCVAAATVPISLRATPMGSLKPG